MSAARRWAEAFERAWRSGDGDAAAALYAKECVFRSQPFRELEDARAYMVRAFEEAMASEAWFGEPREDGDRAAIEYWANLIDPKGVESTLAGCHVVRFGPDGLVAEARDYWHLEPGHLPPPTGWGR
jgi:SnoaL-like domain